MEVEGDPVPHRTAAQVDVEVLNGGLLSAGEEATDKLASRWVCAVINNEGEDASPAASTRYSSFSSWVSGVNSTSSECPTSCDRMESCHHRKSTDMRMALSSGRISRAFSLGSSRSVAHRR